MAIAYKAEKITVTTAATEINPTFDIYFESIYPSDGAVLFRVKNKLGWGDWIEVPEGVSFEDEIEGSRIQVKSVVGSVVLYYFIRSNR